MDHMGNLKKSWVPYRMDWKPEWLWCWFVKGISWGKGFETGNPEKTWVPPFLDGVVAVSAGPKATAACGASWTP